MNRPLIGSATSQAGAQSPDPAVPALQPRGRDRRRLLLRPAPRLGITRGEIERIRGAYVALLPVDPEARRVELEALKRELHLDDPDPTTPGTKRRRTKKANPLLLHEYIAKQSAEAANNKE